MTDRACNILWIWSHRHRTGSNPGYHAWNHDSVVLDGIEAENNVDYETLSANSGGER